MTCGELCLQNEIFELYYVLTHPTINPDERNFFATTFATTKKSKFFSTR